MSDKHISPGFVSPSGAQAIDQSLRDATQDRNAEQRKIVPADDLVMAQLTAWDETNGGYDWTRRIIDGDGAWADHPGGLTYTADQVPVLMPNGTRVPLPFDCFIKRARYLDDGRFAYEVVGEDHPGGHAIVTSETTVSGRYPATRLIETGRPSEWPAAEAMWLEEINAGALYASRIYPFTRFNTDTFLGAKQAGTVECCDAPSAASCCSEFDLPHTGTYMCLRFEVLSGSCTSGALETALEALRVPLYPSGSGQWQSDGFVQYPISGGGGYYTNFFRATIFCWQGGPEYRLTLEHHSNTFFITSSTPDSTPSDCDPFAWQNDTFRTVADGGADCGGLTIRAIVVEVADPEADCVGSGSPGCIPVSCDPGLIPASIPLTFAITSGACGGVGDGQETDINYFSNGGGLEDWWLSTGTLDGEEFYIAFICVNGDTSFATGYPQITFPNVGGGTTFTGTFTESPEGTWTLLIEDIDIGNGCVYQVGGSFDEADCA